MKQVVAANGLLTIVDAEVPVPGAGQVLIAIEAAGVGLIDVLMRQGANEDVRFVPGIEVAGTVCSAGPDVHDMPLGSRVFAQLPSGGYAESVVADARTLVPLPEDVSAMDAVGLGVNALVARLALERAGMCSGERVLVRGASGGIGIMAVQLAALSGAQVIASTRSDDAEPLHALGATQVVGASAEEVEEVDVIIDLVAGSKTGSFISRLRANGRMVIAGIAGGMPPDDFAKGLIPGFRSSLSVSTFSLDTVPPADIRAATKDLFALAAAGRLATVVQQLPLSDATKAHEILSKGGLFGKLVLRPT